MVTINEEFEPEVCNLSTIDNTKAWLRAHTVSTDLHVIKWDGHTPYISIGPTKNRLLELEANDALARAVLIEHLNRRHKSVDDLNIKSDITSEE